MHTFTRVFYHIVWKTKYSKCILTDELINLVRKAIYEKAKIYKCSIYAINGYENHIHLLLYIPITEKVCDIVRKLKGYSSYSIRSSVNDFRWQNGYSVFTVSESNVDLIKEYINNQTNHHQKN